MRTAFAYCLFFAFLVCLLSTSCKKNAPAPDSPKTVQLVRTWQVSRVTQTGVSAPLYQNPLPAGASNAEDYRHYSLRFLSPNEYQRMERDRSFQSGTWAFAAGETKLVFDPGTAGKEISCDLVELSERSLKFRYPENSTKTGNRELLMEFTPVN